jgi:hypothetical protein
VPALVDKWGNVNATAAVEYYTEQRRAWLSERGGSPTGRNARKTARRAADRFADARTRAELYTATQPEFDAVARTAGIIDYGMSRYVNGGFTSMRDSVVSNMTKEVAMYNRDTLLFNSTLDNATTTVQRVAEPSACSFCRLMAFSSTRSASGQKLDVRTANYAIDFHDRCRCSIEVLFEGQEAIRPDYYDKFEDSYLTATSNVGASDFKEVLSEMRRVSKTA